MQNHCKSTFQILANEIKQSEELRGQACGIAGLSLFFHGALLLKYRVLK